MKRLRGYTITALAFAALLLGGCAVNTTKPSLTAQWYQSCSAYAAAQKALIANMHRMTDKQLQQALVITHQITPLCATVPKDPTAATQKITQAVTTLTVLEAIQGVKK